MPPGRNSAFVVPVINSYPASSTSPSYAGYTLRYPAIFCYSGEVVNFLPPETQGQPKIRVDLRIYVCVEDVFHVMQEDFEYFCLTGFVHVFHFGAFALGDLNQ